ALMLSSPGSHTNATHVKSTVVTPARKTQVEQPARSGKLWIALVAIALVAAAALIGLKFWPSSDSKTASTNQPTSTVESTPERALSYSITVQKDPRRYPGSRPFQIPGEVIFSVGDRVRFTFNFAEPGYLYIINEGPQSDFNVLFPSETSNNHSALISASQQIQIPERGDGFIFDAEEGTEKLWLVWSANAVSELEAVKQWANPKDKGEIKDAAQVAALREFLSNNSTSASVEKDEERKQTVVKSKGERLVKLIKLEHH
ncbi:MAG TPA: DUF4384 domain-containing protein, partial [Blastocatellia bacterium]